MGNRRRVAQSPVTAAGAGGGGERVSGWLGVLWPVIEKASGVTLLVMLVMLVLAYQEITRVHRHNEQLVERLLATKDQHLAWLQQHGRCAPAPAGEGR